MRPTRREWIALSEQRLAVADHKGIDDQYRDHPESLRGFPTTPLCLKKHDLGGQRDGAPSTFQVRFSAFVVRADENGLLLL